MLSATNAARMLWPIRRVLFYASLFGALCVVPAAHAAETPPDVARGEHIANAMAHCTECHGADLGGGGRAFPVGRGGANVVPSNLTSGKGGVGGMYSDRDYIAAIRLGVRPDGTHLAIMPASDYAFLTDADIENLVAYIRSKPPVDRNIARVAVDAPPSAVARPPALSSGASLPSAPMPLPLPSAPSEAVYLAEVGGCLRCHGADLHGHVGRNFFAPDISHGALAAWSVADFTSAMRSGRTPDGHMLAEPMPWRSIGRLTDAELGALYHLIEAAPARTSSPTAG